MATGPAKRPVRVLVVDDDPIGRSWLTGLLEDSGAQVVAVDTLARARHALAGAGFDHVLCDRRLPDGDGSVLPGSTVLAVPPCWHAMSAHLDPALRAELRAAGYAQAWEKPIDAGVLLSALGLARACDGSAAVVTGSHRERGPDRSIAAAVATADARPDYDDAAGLIACGDATVLAGLRELLRAELPDSLARIAADWHGGRRAETAEALHRLLAGARFCGAVRLATAAAELEARACAPPDPVADASAFAAFSAACGRLLAA